MAQKAMSISDQAIAARTKERAYLYPMQLMQDWFWSLRQLFASDADTFTRLNLLTTSIIFWSGLYMGMQAGYMAFVFIVLTILFGSLPPLNPLFYMTSVLMVSYGLTHVILRFVKVLHSPYETRMARFLFLIPAAFSCGIVVQCLIFMANQITGMEERLALSIILLIWAVVSIIPIRNYL